jgi:ribosomal-protein-alanine N-acetyltransferase
MTKVLLKTNQVSQVKFELMQHIDLPQVIEIMSEVNLGIWRIDDYKEELGRNDSYLLTAKECQNVIGFIAVRFTLADINNKSICLEADIINIGVLKNHQGKGIGSSLLNKFLISARQLKIKTVWLEVRESNIKAQKFYRLNGFVQVQKRINFYTQPLEDALIMQVELADSFEISN